MNFTTDNCDLNLTLTLSNSTENGVPLIKTIHDVLIVTLLVMIMFSMGCLITINEIWVHLRRPIGVLIGMVSQFVLLPFAAFSLVKIFGTDSLQATGVLILASSPGGVSSNIFTYFTEGDLSLSVSMTTCSTILALGMMPTNVWLYGQLIESQGCIKIPYSKIGLSIVFVTTPVAFGILTKRILPRVAEISSKVGTYCGFALIFLAQALELIIYPDIFSTINSDLYAILLILPGVSFILGYVLALVFRQTPKIRRTIAMECSMQNVGLSLTVIALSFSYQTQKSVIAFTYLYPVPMLATATIAVIVYKVYKRFHVETQDVSKELPK